MWIERALRVVALVAIALLLARSILRREPDASLERASSDRLGEALRRWSTGVAPGRVHLELDSVPGAPLRDWLRAIARSETRLTWSATHRVGPSALAVLPVADPQGVTEVAMATSRDGVVALSDEVGSLDTVRVPSGVARLVAGEVVGTTVARGAGAVASAAAVDSLRLRRVMVVGGAGWETKFLIAALEERGWSVDARVRVAPGVVVEQGSDVVPDTGRHAAVVVLDSTVGAAAPAIVRYVRQGGGLVLVGDAADVASFVAVRAGRAGAATVARPITPADSAPRGALSLRTIEQPATDAVVLERRGPAIAVAARRVARGRVVQVGYMDTWRWRLAGAGDPVAAHRQWWARVVSAVAHAPSIALPMRSPLDPAPYASLVSALGPPVAVAPADPVSRRDAWPSVALLFTVALTALIGEWGARRLRGAA